MLVLSQFGCHYRAVFVIQDVRMAEVEQLLVASGLQSAVITNLLSQIKMQPYSAPPASSSTTPPLPADDVSPTLPLDSLTAALLPEPSAPSTPVRPIVCKLEDEPSLPKHADVLRGLEQQVLAKRSLLAASSSSGPVHAEKPSPIALRSSCTPSADLGQSAPASQQLEAACATLPAGIVQAVKDVCQDHAGGCVVQDACQAPAAMESACVAASPPILMTEPHDVHDADQHLQTQLCPTTIVLDAHQAALDVKDAEMEHAGAVGALQNQFRDELVALKAKFQAEATEATAAIMADLQLQQLKLAKEADDQVSAARAAAAQAECHRLRAEQSKAAMILEMQDQQLQLAKDADDKVSAARAAAAQAERDRLQSEQSKSVMILELQAQNLKLSKDAEAQVCAAKTAAARVEHDRVQALNALAAKHKQDQRTAALHDAETCKALEAASMAVKELADKHDTEQRAAELRAEEMRKSDEESAKAAELRAEEVRKSDEEAAKAAELHCVNNAVIAAAVADAVTKATASALAELQEMKAALQAAAASKLEAAHAAAESKQHRAATEQELAKSTSPAEQSLTGAVTGPAGSTNDPPPSAVILAGSHAMVAGGRPRRADAVFTASTHHTEYVAYSRQCQAKCRSDSLMAKQFHGTAEQRAEGFQMFMKVRATVLCSELC